jgi:hypothetical protein
VPAAAEFVSRVTEKASTPTPEVSPSTLEASAVTLVSPDPLRKSVARGAFFVSDDARSVSRDAESVSDDAFLTMWQSEKCRS